MQSFAAVSDAALSLSASIWGSEVKRGLLMGMTLAFAFIWGP